MGSSGKAILTRKARNKDPKRKPKTMFEEFLAMDMNKGVARADDDLELEKRLAKKLKVKGGKLKSSDDGMDELIDGIPSMLDSMFDDGDDDDIALDDENDMNGDDETVVKPDSSCKKRKRKKPSQPSAGEPDGETVVDEVGESVEETVSSHKKHKRKKSVKTSGEKLADKSAADLPKMEEEEEEENMVGLDNKEPETSKETAPKVDVSVKYVAPHLRASTNKESEEILQVRRRIRGLLNRLSESNVESITGEVAAIFRTLSRSVGCQIMGEEVVVSCSRGPRGNEHFRILGHRSGFHDRVVMDSKDGAQGL